GRLFTEPLGEFTTTILNPPYKKIQIDSTARSHLRSFGVETSNLYTGFLACAASLLAVGGDMVAITPRSFCNGLYFRPFREWFLAQMAFRRLHLFESRKQAFRDDAVLQENVIFAAARSNETPRTVNITISEGAAIAHTSARSTA